MAFKKKQLLSKLKIYWLESVYARFMLVMTILLIGTLFFGYSAGKTKDNYYETVYTPLLDSCYQRIEEERLPINNDPEYTAMCDISNFTSQRFHVENTYVTLQNKENL